ncbi:MAG: hypothetical protein EBZ95_04815 [Chitinophagia bacterium]|nr:hypothetical protein [Chitinophagia bacterium]
MAKKRKLKKNIRTKSLYPANMPKVRREFLDYDAEYLKFLKKNHPEEYLYLAQFVDEWVGANIRKSKKTNRVLPGHLHSTNKLAKERYDANNRRNNDILGVARANNLANDVINELQRNDGWYITDANLTEDALISSLEQKNNTDNLLTKEEFEKVKDILTPDMYLFYLAYFDILD